jgi:hypothetical protein
MSNSTNVFANNALPIACVGNGSVYFLDRCTAMPASMTAPQQFIGGKYHW